MALTGQRIVVIGGSSGMGLATAHAAASAGAIVTIASSSGERVAAALAELPGTCDGAELDIRDEAAVADLFARVGELDHVVFTAGDRFTPRPLGEIPLEDARHTFDVRFWGSVTAAKYAAARIRPGGSIVFTTGTVGVRPAPGAALAAAGAGAIEGLTRGLAVDLAPIRVNAVRSGAVRTPMWDAVPEPAREGIFDTLAGRALTGAIGEPEQIAAAHLYLMENQFVTGTVTTVDGGFVLTGK
ncbi:SDR family oxidoreductase [Actinospica sp. MGRD01-02]|uniref:SDR family oxidoreductase n=1 Tax=Actinospica acidithermotolerans TaxID=2828514 RepID=A0A941EBC9_9ACTN|nr:SDR family oxidoreductase [Actinospica acidithermotolerans]MBR7828381.1 SDR family oxidoreductase [Actinospica acidithermotolerans]